MKAITFLEWLNSNIIYERVQKYNLHEQINFYSQPFKPEMIVEFFEGWHKVGKGEIYYVDGCDQYYFQYEIDGKKFTTSIEFFIAESAYTIDGDYYKRFPNKFNTLTLDHFISDCQRAGIELTFKIEIINKYFK
jgi:hypothetical protein